MTLKAKRLNEFTESAKSFKTDMRMYTAFRQYNKHSQMNDRVWKIFQRSAVPSHFHPVSCAIKCLQAPLLIDLTPLAISTLHYTCYKHDRAKSVSPQDRDNKGRLLSYYDLYLHRL